MRERAFSDLRARRGWRSRFCAKFSRRRRTWKLAAAWNRCSARWINRSVAPEKIRQLRYRNTGNDGRSEAKQVLQKLAKGYAGHRQTKQAQESLARGWRAPISSLAWLDKEPPAAWRGEGRCLRCPHAPGNAFRHQGSVRHVATRIRWLAFSDDGSAVYVKMRRPGSCSEKSKPRWLAAVAPKGGRCWP